MEGMLVSRSLCGAPLLGKKVDRLPCLCQAVWNSVNYGFEKSGFSPLFSSGDPSMNYPSISSSRPSLDSMGACEPSLPAENEEVRALVQVQKDGDTCRSNQFQTLAEDMAMGLILRAATGTGWTTGSGLEGPSNLFEGQSLAESDEHKWPMLSKSPRRRMRVAFTCNVCGKRTTRAINPHAYTDGTVFVQCGGCNVFHKLVDNLKLFHELKGSVFPNTVMYGSHDFAEHQSYDYLGLDDLSSS